MGAGIVNLTDSDLRRGDQAVGRAGAGRLLGRVVRAVQDDRAHAGGDPKDFAGRLKVAKLNVDDAQSTARRFEVMSIPTLILFKDGEAAAAHRRCQGQGSADPGDRSIPVEGLPLGLGSSGEPVADLQRRLATLGYGCRGDDPGSSAPTTGHAVRGVPDRRGACASTGSAASRPGRRSSRPATGSATGGSTSASR